MKKTIKIGAILGLALYSGMASADGSVISQNLNVAFDVGVRIFQVIGFLVFSFSLYSINAVAKGQGRQKTYGKVALEMFVGALLISLGWIYSIVKESIIGNTTEPGVDFTDSSTFNIALDSAAAAGAARLQASGFGKFMPQDTMQMLLAFIFLYGLIAFATGWLKLKDVPDDRGGGGYAKPTIMIIGGVLCMNILWFGCLVGRFIDVPALCTN